MSAAPPLHPSTAGDPIARTAAETLSPFGPVACAELPVEVMPADLAPFAYDLAITLESGQSFCWRRFPAAAQPGLPQAWIGWAGDIPCVVSQTAPGEQLRVIFPSGAAPIESSVAALRTYFQTDTAYTPLLRTFPSAAKDPHLARAMRTCGGMRILRQPAWEATASFICSAQKQILQIMQINAALRRSYADRESDSARLDHLWPFPHPDALAAQGEEALRLCKLGFRARHLFRTAGQIAAGDPALPSPDAIMELPLPAAVESLTRFHGVGEKVASCILLFAYQRTDAFPVDVWIQRILSNLYIRRKADAASPEYIRAFATRHFGPHAGVAQQILFHWYRTGQAHASG